MPKHTYTADVLVDARRSEAVTRSSLKTRLKVSAFVGLAIIAAWLYYTVNQVLTLYDVTRDIQRTTDLRERVGDAKNALAEAEDSLDRYTQGGEGYDLSRHHASRTTLRAALGAIRRRILTESSRGSLEQAEASEEMYSKAADRAIARWAPGSPSAARQVRDDVVEPAAASLREALEELGNRFGRVEAVAEGRLDGARDSATAALVILAALILAGVLWLLTDVGRHILEPVVSASRALGDLASDREPPNLFEASGDEVGELGRQFNRAAAAYGERARALAERDIQASVNSVLAVAATVNDLEGFGSKVLQTVVSVSGAASALLYLPEAGGAYKPTEAVGWIPGEDGVGPEEARRAATEKKAIFVSVDPKTPTINVFDGRILPRESVHIPLIYFDHVVGVLALGSAQLFTANARNVISAIAPSLAVALANAAANERVAEQTRRLSEQNELLEDQRSRIGRVNRELQRASALKDRFLASVSHELRTPMTVILGFTAALLKGGQGNLNAQQRESLERVQRNAKLLLGLINDVLDISKIEAGKVEIHRQRVLLPTLARQVEADYGEAARNKRLTLRSEIAPGLESVTTDPERVMQIIANLVGNALKFTERGSITVRFEPREPDSWAIVVSDTGIGIPQEEQSVIFEEFRQGEAVEHRGRGGTGLGLAIVKKLAAVLGGSVTIESVAGEGSRFTVVLPRELPRDDEASATTAETEAWPVVAPEDVRRVLIVDDDESVRRLFAYELESLGVRILEAGDGRSAVEIATAERPDAILLDVLLPGVDGWETLRLLKQRPETRNIPVVILSVVDNRTFGLSLGAFDYLVKPVEVSSLVDSLSRAGVLATRGHLLVVDDDADVRNLLAQGLVSAGYRVQSVEGGAEALAAMARERPSAVLLDLMMRPPDGFEVLCRMREDADLRDIPVIIVTAKDLTEKDREILRGAANRVIRKAADPASLVTEVLRAVQEEKTA
jgi:signal transduction histidine kinase/DNA-binding response OmpR family regulator